MSSVDRFDAAVVGGGLAGVIAARDLAHGGLETVLIEARDRLGGRTASQRLAGRDIDTGGAYFHWFQAAIWTEVQRYELELVDRPLADRYLIGDGERLVAWTPEALDKRLRRLLSAFWGDPSYPEALSRPFAVQTQRGGIEQLDGHSVDDRLRQLALDPLDDSLLRALFMDFGRPLDEVSLAWVLQRAANAVWSYEAFDALFAVYRLAGGMRSLIDAIVSDGGFEVRLSSTVREVEHTDSDARLQLVDGSAVEARAVVIATPVNVWKTIAFTPALPDIHRRASEEGLAAPAHSNVVMHVRGLPGALNVFAPYGSEPFELMFTQELLEDGQLLAAHGVNGRVTASAESDQIRAALQRVAPDAELVEFVGHDWATDRCALGGTGSLRVGQLTRFIGVLDEPQGRLFFASGDIAPQFPGFLTGAVESGVRAAQRAKALLRRGSRVEAGRGRSSMAGSGSPLSVRDSSIRR